jgi:hypothetical protein
MGAISGTVPTGRIKIPPAILSMRAQRCNGRPAHRDSGVLLPLTITVRAQAATGSASAARSTPLLRSSFKFGPFDISLAAFFGLRFVLICARFRFSRRAWVVDCVRKLLLRTQSWTFLKTQVRCVKSRACESATPTYLTFAAAAKRLRTLTRGLRHASRGPDGLCCCFDAFLAGARRVATREIEANARSRKANDPATPYRFSLERSPPQPARTVECHKNPKPRSIPPLQRGTAEKSSW